MTERNQVVLVDSNDNTIDVCEKLLAHQKGLLHRAFSVMLYRYNNGVLEFLLQKRADSKYHCPGLWTNTCCSHPGLNEDIKQSAFNRLTEELVDLDLDKINLKNISSFVYKAEFSNGLIEHEYDHVFVAEYNNTPINFNKDEVSEVKWLNIEQITEDYKTNPKSYTAWFYNVFEKSLDYIS